MEFDFNKFVLEQKAKGTSNKDERRIGFRKLRSFILIICEGKKTEPNYFESFRRLLPKGSLKNVMIEGAGRNTDSLVDKAKEIVDRRKKSSLPNFDMVWIVFDRDSFTKEQVNSACKAIEDAKFSSAFSNEAFELWYVLHFQYLDSKITRDDYIKKLNGIFKKLGINMYKKNSNEMYDILQKYGDQGFAIKNALKLRNLYASEQPSDQKPSTKVDLLVQELNKYIES